jgi:antitoxin VapB
MKKKEELALKLTKLREFMKNNEYRGVLFGTQHNFSWLTGGGDNQIIHGSEIGFVNILVTPDDALLITNNIEMPRVVEEETEGLDFTKDKYPWTGSAVTESVRKVLGKGRLAADFPFADSINEAERLNLFRVPLTENEVYRYKTLAGMCRESMDETMHSVEPGMTEYEIQGTIGGKLMARGIYPVVLLVGTDERIFNFRHPMPTEKKLDKYCMVVICAQRWGLILSMTRLVHFGKLPEETLSRYEALQKVDMAYITSTKKGSSLKEVFEAGRKAYAEVGFRGEEEKHFQGGTCGYLAREQGLDPRNGYKIRDGEIFAHNPTITGTKIEDSIMVSGENFEVLTMSDNWPSKDVEYRGITLQRPEILIR